MSTGATLVRQPRSTSGLWPTVVPLSVGAGAMALIFQPECAAALHVWITSTAFGHCFLVLPIALFLAWERRAGMRTLITAGVRPQALSWAPLLILPLALGWLVAERLGIMEGRQFMALAMVEVGAFALLGRRFWRVLAVPLLYLFFLVPFGAFLTPALQAFTARFIDTGLAVLDIPHVMDAAIIETPAGVFRVAEACAGLRFLIASIAFGVLYACTMYRGTGRRIIFVAASIVVPIIANGLRALGIVVLGQILGDARAAVVDHIVYGWLFFSAVTLLLTLAGLPFRQDRTVAQMLAEDFPPENGSRQSAWALPCSVLALVLVLAALGPAIAVGLDRAAGSVAGTTVRPIIVLPQGCSLAPADGRSGMRHVVCEGIDIEVRSVMFGPRASPQRLLTAERTLAGPGEVITTRDVSGGWTAYETTEPLRIYATRFRTTPDGASAGGLGWRVRQARASTFGGGDATWYPMLTVATVENPQVGEASRILSRFVAAQAGAAAE